MIWLDHLIEEAFADSLYQDQKIRKAVLVARMNSDDGLWLIGGSVFRRVANIMYGTPIPENTDCDFLVGELVKEPTAPPGWQLEKNSFGNPKFTAPGIQVDLCPLPKVHSIVRRKIAPTIWNWMTGTPLNIQSILFDCNYCQLLGDIGIRALKEKLVAVNDPIQAQIYAERKGKPIEEIVREKAAELNFSYKL